MHKLDKLIDCFIFDIDGTLANTDHRNAFLRHEPRNWKAWHSGMEFDSPYQDVIDLTHIYHNSGFKIFIVTGRDIQYKPVTKDWLDKYNVYYDDIYMATGHEPDNITKVRLVKEIIEKGHNILGIYDDRLRVVKAFRENGWRVYCVNDTEY